jgi:hypothetical protein
MIAQQNGSALDVDGYLLMPDEVTPRGDEVIETPGGGVEKVHQAGIVGLLHEPESAPGGKSLDMRHPDEAKNDQSKQDPRGVSRKERAEGAEHVVKIGESQHEGPPCALMSKGNLSDVCSTLLSSAMRSGHASTSPCRCENL